MRIIFIENDSLLNNNLQFLLEGENGTEWVEGYTTAEQACKEASWDDATVLLTDIHLPNMSGIELISWTRQTHPHVTSMVFSETDHRETVQDAIKAGACGYLLKSSSPRELIESLWQLVGGGAPMSPRIARQVILGMQQVGTERTLPENLLTTREREILLLVEQGLAYKEIAEELFISPHTVHTHVKKIYEKVEASGRQAVINKARNMGWI